MVMETELCHSGRTGRASWGESSGSGAPLEVGEGLRGVHVRPPGGHRRRCIGCRDDGTPPVMTLVVIQPELILELPDVA